MGSLHERNPSLWVETTYPGTFPALQGDTEADVAIIGAGLTGLNLACVLADEGASVVVIDAGSLCAGASGYTTAKVTSLHGLAYTEISDRFDKDRARSYGEANESAIGAMEELAQRHSIDCAFERRPHVAYTTDPNMADAVFREAELAADLGLPAAPHMPDELPFDIAAAVRFSDQAQFHPRAYALGLANTLIESGARIYTHTRARHVDAREGLVATDHGRVHAKEIVVATHLPFKELGGYFARTRATRSYAMAVDVDGPRPHAMYIGVHEPVRSLRTAGEQLIIGGEGHLVGDRHDTREHYRNLESWGRAHFSLRGVTHRWSAQDWRAADGLPYIGRMAGHRHGLYVATAFRKWGMAHSMVAALIIRDLIAGRENPWHGTFDATRVEPVKSAKEVGAINVDVAKHFVGDRLDTAPPDDVDALAPGDGAVVRVDGRKVAAFRDENGTLHAVSATCTHLGCLTNFNAAEQSWDCPCHGSRFNARGEVLEGPATDDLESEDL